MILEGEGKVKHTKFVVVKLREVVKTAIFAVLGLVILIGLITFFLKMGGGEESGQALYQDGTYEGELQRGNTKSTVAVTVRKGKIKDVSLTKQDDAFAVMYPLMETAVKEVKEDVVKKQSAAVDEGKEYTYSAQAILDVVQECLAEAKTE